VSSPLNETWALKLELGSKNVPMVSFRAALDIQSLPRFSMHHKLPLRTSGYMMEFPNLN
jgi:hypothetical protein